MLNTLLDIIANIGLRLSYFTQTAPQLGNNFFIHYLEMSDFSSILKNSSQNICYQTIHDMGPNFPKQTMCCFRTTKLTNNLFNLASNFASSSFNLASKSALHGTFPG